MKIRISNGNSKMGKVPSISLPPVESCGVNMPCIGECYAMKAFRMYPSARAAWQTNLHCYQDNAQDYFEQITRYVKPREPRLFRFHVAGDIMDQVYLDGMFMVASACEQTKFLAFTKQHRLDFSGMPSNFSIVASFWPNWGEPDKVLLPKAWMQNGNETRIPNDAVECFGNCDSCGICWSLAKLGKDVYFHKH